MYLYMRQAGVEYWSILFSYQLCVVLESETGYGQRAHVPFMVLFAQMYLQLESYSYTSWLFYDLSVLRIQCVVRMTKDALVLKKKMYYIQL